MNRPIPNSELAGPVTPLAGSASPRCPDCDTVFSYRFRDEDTGCSYPVDDGEHYCSGCDSIWTDAALSEASFEPLVFVERISPTRIAL